MSDSINKDSTDSSMNRRSFIASSLVGMGSIAMAANNTESMSQSVVSPSEIKVLYELENEIIKFNLNNDGSCQFLDKKTQTTWASGPVAFQEEKEIDEGYVWVRTDRSMAEQYPGRFLGEKTARGIHFKLIGPENRMMGSFIFNCKLRNNWIEMKITDIDESIPTLCYPTPLYCNSLIIPQGEGKWIKEPIPGRKYFPFFSGLRMRWFGGLKENNRDGYICIFDKGIGDAGVMGSELSLFPVWQKSLGKWSGERSVLIGFTNNGYVGMAKRFRKWAQDSHLFKTLHEKGIASAGVKQVIGARLISMMQSHPALLKKNDEAKLIKSTLEKDGDIRVLIDHKHASDLIKIAKQENIDKCVVNLRGWFRGGYDYAHPDVWPPEPALGSEDDFRKLCNSGSNGYKIILHDNYQDIYEHNPSWPKGVIIRKNGKKMRGGFWAPGQCYILNARNGYQYAIRNWKILKTLQTDGMCIDTVGATQLYESYEKGNTLTRSQCLHFKEQTLKFYSDQGLVTMTEEGADYTIPHVHLVESWRGRVPGESIPLWSLVYHDCVMNYRIDPIGGEMLWGRDLQEVNASNIKKRWLEEALYGYGLATWGLPIKYMSEFKELLSAGKQLDKVFKKVVTSEMIEHQIVSDDDQLEQTIYQNGIRVIVNFSEESHEIDGKVIRGQSYILS